MPGRIERIRSHYEARMSADRPNYEVLDWAGAETQQARFEVLPRNVELDGKSLLDVGCGLGDLYDLLRSRGIGADYTGVDILESMVQAARRAHPGARFVCADVFEDDPFGAEAFDVVFCSGAFNLNLGNNAAFLPRAIGRLLELARDCVVLNLLHARAKSTDDRYFHHHPREVLKMLKKLPCRARVIDDYLHNDFTVICAKARRCSIR
jgi:SAM-dependent methyltransferase